MQSLKQFYEAENCQSDKGNGHSYIQEYYTHEFTEKRHAKIKLLEIGIWKGESLELWNSWFEQGEITGCDVTDERMPRANRSAFINYIFGDAYSSEVLNKLGNDFDYIIDDGPHSLESQILAVQLYLPKLKSGGKLIIEDIQKFADVILIIEAADVSLLQKAKVFDLRNVVGRYDDIIIELTKL